MNDVYIEFEGTGREGAVAIGSYVLDAAKRLGVELECDCAEEDPSNACAVRVIKGGSLLSPLTNTEIEQLGASERKDGERLACQTKIEKAGELVLMTVKKKENKKSAAEDKKGAQDNKSAEEYKKEFQALPLDEKISSLVELEAIALGETISFVLNSPYKAFGKVMDVMAGFGHEKERKDKESKVPDEHKKESGSGKKSGHKKASKDTATGSEGKSSKPAESNGDQESSGSKKKEEGAE